MWWARGMNGKGSSYLTWVDSLKLTNSFTMWFSDRCSTLVNCSYSNSSHFCFCLAVIFRDLDRKRKEDGGWWTHTPQNGKKWVCFPIKQSKTRSYCLSFLVVYGEGILFFFFGCLQRGHSQTRANRLLGEGPWHVCTGSPNRTQFVVRENEIGFHSSAIQTIVLKCFYNLNSGSRCI